MKRVYVVRNIGFPFADWEEVSGKSEIDLQSGTFGEFLRLHHEQRFDLFIYPLDGFVIMEGFRQQKDNPLFAEFLNDHEVKKVAWTMDTHHEQQVEQKLQDYFDTYYVAHANYLGVFRPGKAKHLPCRVHFDVSRRDVLPLLAKAERTPKSYDAVSVYVDYLGIGDRNAEIWRCMEECEDAGLRTFFGRTKQHGNPVGMVRYFQAMLSGRVILNVSIMDDFNMRNFEALMLNQVMVTNRVPDHAIMDLDYSNAVFYERGNRRSFREAMREGLAKASRPHHATAAQVLNHHTLIHRYVEIINDQLGTNLRVPDIDVEKTLAELRAQPMGAEPFVPDAAKGDSVYDRMELGAKAVHAFLAYQQPREALEALTALLEKEPAAAYPGHLEDFLASLRLCQAQGELLPELCRASLYEALQRAMAQNIDSQQFGRLLAELPPLMDASPASQRLARHLLNFTTSALSHLADAGRWEEAAAYMQAAEKLPGKDAREYHLAAARVARNCGQPQAAMEHYRAALGLAD